MTMALSKIKYMLKYIVFLVPILVMMPNQVNANNAIVADHRYTFAAQAADYAQCSSLWAVYVTAKVTATFVYNAACLQGYISMLSNPFTAGAAAGAYFLCLQTVPPLSELTALASLYGAYQAYSDWATDIRKNSKIVNTVDQGKDTCDDNLSNAQNSAQDDDSLTRSWAGSGPLANYCYKRRI